jgi:hypothetical protein
VRSVIRITSILSIALSLVLTVIIFVPRAIYGAPKGNWLTWQSDSTCELPCWRGITPGKTTFKQAEAILRNMPAVSVTMFHLPDGSEVWTGRFTLQTLNGAFQGTISLPSLNYLDVQPIGGIMFANFRGTSAASLIQQLGAPAYVYMPESASNRTLNIYWRQGVGIQTIQSRNAINTLCDVGFQNLRTSSITLENTKALESISERWTGYEGLRDVLCTSTR